MNLVVNTLTRQNDTFALVDTLTWTNTNDWKAMFTPGENETGEILMLFTDSIGAKRFIKTFYCVTQFPTSYIVSIGSTTISIVLRDNNGVIEAKHDNNGNYTCSLKWRKIVNVA